MNNDRLATTDAHGHRVYVYPEDITGFWKSLRQKVYGFLIFVFMVLPWIYFKGQQVILLDIPKREFVFFGETFYGHDAPFIVFILLAFVLLMGLVTTLWGRIWCGWACPQTVFIQGVFGKIERWVEGSARRRQKRDQCPMDAEKLFKKSLKWFLFTIVSLHISHSFLGYFVGTHELLSISFQNPTENLTLFFIMLFFTGLFLFDFGWFREQFCIIACPYGRFQSVMMDENSLVVAYDEKRGEPRKHKDVPKEKQGDCVSCMQCVRACPTGIDIREGASQLECIACTQCIDACDSIMERLGKPKGLIRYASENELLQKKTQWIRPRSIVYGVLLALVVGTFALTLERRMDIDAVFVRKGSSPYTVIQDGKTILNRYSAKITNYSGTAIELKLALTEDYKDIIDIVGQRVQFELEQGNSELQIFVRFPKDILEQGSQRIDIQLLQINPETGDEELLKTKELRLVGPRS